MSHRYRLYPTPEQAEGMMTHCNHRRFVWNLALEQADLASTFNRYPDWYEWDQQLTEARQANPWLEAGSSMVQQQALRDLRQAFKNWWSNPSHFGRPTYRRKSGSQGFCVVSLEVAVINRRWAVIKIPKVGKVKFRLSRPLPDGAKSARITLDRSGCWHVSITSPQPSFQRAQTGEKIGLDAGVTHTLTTSDGKHLDMPDLLSPGKRRRLQRLQRSMARQQPGSKRRARTRQQIAKLKARETNRRSDWIERTTTELVRDYDLIVIEDLNIKNMTRSASGTISEPGVNVAQKRGLNRAILEQAWGTIRRRLEDKTEASTAPSVLVVVNPQHTSQQCSACMHTAKKNRKNQADFSCQACGHKDNADVNAALNILAAGERADRTAVGQTVAGRGGSPKRAREASTIRAA